MSDEQGSNNISINLNSQYKRGRSTNILNKIQWSTCTQFYDTNKLWTQHVDRLLSKKYNICVSNAIDYSLQFLQRPVQPTSCDTKICFVRSDVMNTMMTSRQYNMIILQKNHPFRQPPVGV